VQTAFINADVITLDAARPRAAGVLVRDGRVEGLLAAPPVGLSAEVRVVDCQGGALLPGLHDCHVHLTDAGLLAGRYDIRDCVDIDAVLRRVAELAREAAADPAAPLYAGNYDESLIAEARPPRRDELDSAEPARPVLLTRVDGHSCVVNSAAFALLGVAGLAGVERDAAGEPTGRLIGPANYAAQGVVRRLSPAARRAASRRAAEAALSGGMTTVHHVIANDAPFEELEETYRDDAALPLRVISKTCSMDVRKVKRLGGRVFGGDIFVDGSIGSRTAAVDDAYRGTGGHGLLYLTRAQLGELFDEAAQAGLSLGVHAIGDRAIEETIAAWETVVAAHGASANVRPSIDHFEIARPDQIARAARLGMLLSVQPAFDHLWGGDDGMYAQRLGVERACDMNLFKSAKRAGCVICGGSDAPVTAFSALLGIQALVGHHVAQERFTVEEALRAYTVDAAKLSFDESRRGVIAPGYDADFAVLEKRLDAVTPDAIKDVRVLMTIVGGEIRYDANAIPSPRSRTTT
jgi:predicted amidohydrolase YtcJ